MDLFEAVVLGIVEGVTEFLPVSSTGHLILTSRFLGLEASNTTKAYTVVIQSGAILAVLWHYASRLKQLMQGALKQEAKAVRDLLCILIALIPSALVGITFEKLIKNYLFGGTSVALALLIGGIAMIILERRLKGPATRENPDLKGALKIGLFQCLSLWPGMSRSMTTILGGRLSGLSAAKAAEFSLLLAIPTLLGATFLDLLKEREFLLGSFEQIELLLVGLAVSYVVALLCIRSFLRYLTRHSLEVFGWYRIGVGVVYLLAMVFGLGACSLFGDRSTVVAEVGAYKITERMVEYRNQIIPIYNAEETRRNGLELLVQAYTIAEVLKNNGQAIQEKDIKTEEMRIERDSKLPAHLQKIKELFDGDKDAYRKVFVLPTLAERSIYFQFFLNNLEIHKDSYIAAEGILRRVMSEPRRFKEIAKGASLPIREGIVSKSEGIMWNMAGTSSLPAPENNFKAHDYPSARIDEAVQWIREILQPLREGEISPRIIQTDRNWLVVKLTKIQAPGSAYSIEALLFPRRDYGEWLKVEKDKVRIVRHNFPPQRG